MPFVVERIKELVIKNLYAGLDAAEQKELEEWINKSEKNKEAIEEFLDATSLKKGIGSFYATKRRVWQKLLQTIEDEKAVPVRRRNWHWVAAAAVIICITVSGYFIFLNNSKHANAKTQANTEHLQNNIKPGSYKAKLVLADGTEIVLDSATLGKLAQQGNAAVVNQDGKLVYIPGASGDEVVYNTVKTARGETYSLVLADGSKVWLNAASTIRFPVSFTGNERRVDITGEAYFEVAKDAERRFIVTANGITTEVFGTHFNVNTYRNELATRVTLLEGNIQVNKNNVLPGQQAVVNDNGHLEITGNIDLEQAVAWKNGEFQFGDKTDIKTAMRQVERWYDIEVEYRGSFNSHIGGSISRSASLPKILKMLEKTGAVKFEIQDQRIIVSSGQ